MFDNFKQLKKLKELKDSLSKERIEIEKEGVRVVINGKMEMEEVKLNSELDIEQQQRIIKECFNEAVGKIQRIAAEKMMQG